MIIMIRVIRYTFIWFSLIWQSVLEAEEVLEVEEVDEEGCSSKTKYESCIHIYIYLPTLPYSYVFIITCIYPTLPYPTL